MEKAKMSKTGVPYLHLGKGEPLVLIHGLGEVKEGWEDQYELADQFELIIPDLRGHGNDDAFQSPKLRARQRPTAGICGHVLDLPRRRNDVGWLDIRCLPGFRRPLSRTAKA